MYGSYSMHNTCTQSSCQLVQLCLGQCNRWKGQIEAPVKENPKLSTCLMLALNTGLHSNLVFRGAHVK
ncbi:hypothetical protein XELAEV_18036947mg [Xenopus laevis]|uniref:Uncharacterized protein n=1 Tax=Xenopus laevis TaxID=8355 RepID=A0A974H9N6_XENLA|nr:hypothetical protein XELAEV_18036947mg [Xenopus laevis]